jgi:hypothetical protein
MNLDKRESTALAKAELRLTSLKTINPNLDLGDGVSVADFITKIDETRRSLEHLNSTITMLNQLSWSLRDKELEMADLSQRLELGIASKYGKKSNEYYLLTGKSPNARKSSGKRSSTGSETNPVPETPSTPAASTLEASSQKS